MSQGTDLVDVRKVRRSYTCSNPGVKDTGRKTGELRETKKAIN